MQELFCFLVEDSVELKKHNTNAIFSFDEAQKFGEDLNRRNILNRILVHEKEFEDKKEEKKL